MQDTTLRPLGLIGGSGFADAGLIAEPQALEIETPFGPTSAPLVSGTLEGRPVVFLLRHGERHQYAPHRVPNRANLWALQRAGVSGVLAVATVGGIAPDLGPGAVAVPDQLLDYTWGREATYYDTPEAGVRHIDMTHPFDETLREGLIAAASRTGVPVRGNGVYACTQGPRLETAAEVRRFARDGADMIGMTLYPECALARELGLPYAGVCVSVNHAAGIGDSREGIDFDSLKAIVDASVRSVVDVVRAFLRDR